MIRGIAMHIDDKHKPVIQAALKEHRDYYVDHEGVEGASDIVASANAALAALQQDAQPTYFGKSLEQYAVELRDQNHVLSEENAQLKEELRELQGKYGLPNFSADALARELKRRTTLRQRPAPQPPQEDA